MSDASPELAATCRCLREDLSFGEEACSHALTDSRDHPVVECFLEKRRNSPVGQEVIQQLAPRLVAYSLHCGRH